MQTEKQNTTIRCERCSEMATARIHTGFGLETLCAECREAVRQDGQEIASPYPLALEDFAAYQSWREIIRLASMGLDIRASVQHRMRQARANSWLLNNGKRTEWTAMVEGWHRRYLQPLEATR